MHMRIALAGLLLAGCYQATESAPLGDGGMHRIEHTTREDDKHGSGKHGYTGGDPDAGVPPTRPQAPQFDAFQEEIANCVELNGISLNSPGSDSYQQLYESIKKMLGNMAVSNWKRQDPAGGSTATWYASLFANRLFLIAGSNGEIQTSPNGVDWTARTADGSFTGFFRGAAYGAGRFVLVGQNGEIQTSSDGSTWAQRAAAGGYTGTFRAVAWSGSLSLFVAVGESGEIQTSPDGITWTQRTAAGSYAGHFRAAVFGEGLFVAVGADGEIQTSPDGVTWTQRTPAGGFADEFAGIGHSPEQGLFVAVGVLGEIQTSPDGITWTQRSPDASYDNTFQTATYHAGIWVAAGWEGELQTSLDGVTWTERVPDSGFSAAGDFFLSSAFGRGVFLVVGNGGEIQCSLRTGF